MKNFAKEETKRELKGHKKKIKKYTKKVFTKKKVNNIINTVYNPLKVNCKIYEREGLCMGDEVLNTIKRLSKKYNKKEELLLKMIEKCKMFGYNMKESELLIEEFEKQ